MSKKMPVAEFKAAVKALNAVLKEDGKAAIKVVGVAKDTVIENFTNTVLDFIENDRAADLPDEAIELYNEHIATEEDGDEADTPDEKPEKKTAAKGKTGSKTKTAAKGKGKPAPKKKPKEKQPGIVQLSVQAYMEEGCKTAKEICEHLADTFPDRDISKTVSHVFGVLKHITPNK